MATRRGFIAYEQARSSEGAAYNVVSGAVRDASLLGALAATQVRVRRGLLLGSRTYHLKRTCHSSRHAGCA